MGRRPVELAVWALVACLVGAAPWARPAAPQVRVEAGAFVDRDGPFTVLGATLFWGAWGYRHDRARLEANLQFLADHGVQAVRVLAAVGPSGGWEDRIVDPAWPDYDDVVGGLTDLAFDRYGLRVQWTVFGGVDRVSTPEARAALVARLGRILTTRAEKVLFVEIANEGYQNGFGDSGGLEELRALGAALTRETPLLVALTAPQNDAAAPFSPARVHADAPVDVAVLHHDRDVTGALGAWKPVRAPWSVVGRRDAWPPVLASNEPIGPASSVAGESDPARLAGAALVSWLAGHSVYVFHSGPGVRGGGAEDLAMGRAANFFEADGLAEQIDAVARAHRLVPDDIARWTALRQDDERHPFRAEPDVFCAWRDGDFLCAVLTPDGHRQLQPAMAGQVEVVDVATGAPRPSLTLERGVPIVLEAAPGVALLTGRRAGPPRGQSH